MTEEKPEPDSLEKIAFVNDRAAIIIWIVTCHLFPESIKQVVSSSDIFGVVGFFTFVSFGNMLYVLSAFVSRYIEDDVRDLSYRKQWYPGEIFMFRIERLLMCVLFVYVLYHGDGKLDPRVMQYSSYIVFPATNLFFILSANPDLLEPSPEEPKENSEQNKKEINDNASAVEQVIVTISEQEAEFNSEHIKLKEEYYKLCCDHNKLKKENNTLSSELVTAKSQYDVYYELVTHLMNEGLHDKCKEEKNSLLHELGVAKASMETCLSLLHNLGVAD